MNIRVQLIFKERWQNIWNEIIQIEIPLGMVNKCFGYQSLLENSVHHY
jgi:hypothetical protein